MAFTAQMKKALKYQSGMNVQVEVVVDPDGDAYKLDGFHDIKMINPINQELIVDPVGMEQIVLYDLQIEFNDPNEFFCPSAGLQVGYTPFRSEMAYLKTTSTANTVTVDEPSFYPFKANDLVDVTDGNNKETSLVGSVDNTGANQIVNLDTALANTYAAGSVVTNDPIYGKQVTVQVRASGLGLTETQTIFRGVIRKPFTWMNGSAIIYVDNILAEILNENLSYQIEDYNPTPWQKMDNDGTLINGFEWTTQTGSGSFAGGLVVYAGAKIGGWVLTFTSPTAYNITGPGFNGATGSTASDYTNAQIQILSAQWSGTPAIGDVFEFSIRVNYTGLVPSVVLFRTLFTHLGNSVDLIDSSGTFSDAFLATFTTDLMSISFEETITVGEALLVIAAHLPGSLFQNTQGELAVDLLKSDFTYNEPSSSLTGPNVRARDVTIGQTIFYNEFIINYGYDYDLGDNQFQYTYPEADNENPSLKVYGAKRSVLIDVPGIYTEARAKRIAKRHYLFWAFGRKTYTTEGDAREVDLSLINSVYTMTGFDFGTTTFAEKVMGLVRTISSSGITVKITTIKQDTSDPQGAWS